MINPIDQYYLRLEEPNRSCLLTLREFILEQDERVHETLKYESPCFCYKNRMFCFLSVEKKSGMPYLLMVEGRHLDHPLLEAGNRKRMKVLMIDPEEDLPLEILNEILENALDLYRKGIIRSR